MRRKLYYKITKRTKNCPLPVIGRVNGAALGGGCGLVSACDISYAVNKAVFGFTEVKLGLIPAVISPFVMNKIGSHSSQFFLTGSSSPHFYYHIYDDFYF